MRTRNDYVCMHRALVLLKEIRPEGRRERKRRRRDRRNKEYENFVASKKLILLQLQVI